MKHPHTFRLAVLLGLLACLWLLPGVAGAQAPPWVLAVVGTTTAAKNASWLEATATDASGNIFVTGYFTSTLTLGSITLESAGQSDLFVAKYVPATHTWAWAQSGGGTYADYSLGIAVTGSNIYVTGQVFNNAANANPVVFGSTGNTLGTVPLNGTGSTANNNLVVVKYNDLGAAATVAWTQAAGGTGHDAGYGIAVSGSSVYVTGCVYNNTANANAVVFGGSGTTAGTATQYGASATSSPDLVVAKYTDNGPTATLNWTQVGGGTSADQGQAIAVSGPNVYVTGYLTNTATNTNQVLLGGSGATAGTVPQYGTGSPATRDLVLLKYQDNGAGAALGWLQLGGGTGQDQGNGVAVSGNGVYVTGVISNNRANAYAVVFGGSGAAVGTAA